MRIISGTHQGRVIKVPKGLPVRPTTDFAKEGLFNILNNKINYAESKILDLFSGTGHISLEFASRGATDILSVDKNFKCIGFLKGISNELGFGIDTTKSDVFDFLKNCRQKFDIIFADPPYDLENIPTIHELVFKNGLLDDNAWLIIEHGPKTHLELLTFFVQQRNYGNVNFSFFQNKVK